jgi:N-acetylneuraminic acid mutarotase
MISLLSSWLRREVRSGLRSRRPRPARRPVCKPWLELLEGRTLLSSWSTVAPMPTAREGLAAATGFNGRIYAIGGTVNGSPSGTTNTVEAYTPSTNSWSAVASLPTARLGLAAATGFDGRIYAIGGTNGSNVFNTVEAYNPVTNSWSAVATLPTARFGLTAATGFDGRIYAIGGIDNNNVFNTVEAYSPGTNSWSTLTSMPTARAGLRTATGFDGRIYAIGGTNGHNPINTVEAYSPGTNSWSTVASMPTARQGLAAATGIDGRIYAIGGTNGGALNTVEAYGPGTNSWSTVTSMPTARFSLAAATGFDGRIYAIGGFNGGTLKTTEAYTLSISIKVIDGHILQLVDDEPASRFAITDDRHWGINVILNDHSLGVFHGIDRVEIRSGSGDDIVRYTVAGGAGRPADLMLDLGNGADTFTLNAGAGMPELRSARPWDIDIHTGAGKKNVSTLIQGSTPVQMGVDLGAGPNFVDLAFDHIEHMPAASELTVKGGRGDNNIHVSYGFNPPPATSMEPHNEAPITTTIDGGMGAQTIGLTYLFTPQLVPSDPSTVPFNIPLRTKVKGGEGYNYIHVIFAGNPPPGDRSGVSSVQIDAPIEVNVKGGKDADNILVEFLAQAPSERPGTQLVLNSRFQMRLDGGDGNDRIEADLFFASQSRGFVDAEVFGGRGDDFLMLDIHGYEDPNLRALLRALIDGGDGVDIAVATRNVMVRHCEEVRWL